MAGPASETVTPPFTGFNFAVEIAVPGVSQRICHAAFSDCDGLEMTMEVKTLREGGNNGRQIRLAGPMSFGLVTLKRGMTRSFDLWNWMARAVAEPGLRADAEIVLLAADGQSVHARFVLSRCLPAKLKAPSLTAREGGVAIEELQLAYEALELKPGSGGGVGAGAGLSVGASLGASAGGSFGGFA
jgi:phage tail-like protein